MNICPTCGAFGMHIHDKPPTEFRKPNPASSEWTQSYVCELSAKANPEQAIADAHNAALAQVEKEWERIITGHAKTNQDIVDDYVKQLAAEREKRMDAEYQMKNWLHTEHQLREQLAAAVEALKELRRSFPINDKQVNIIDAALEKIGTQNWIRAEDNPGFARHE